MYIGLHAQTEQNETEQNRTLISLAERTLSKFKEDCGDWWLWMMFYNVILHILSHFTGYCCADDLTAAIDWLFVFIFVQINSPWS